MLTELDPLTTGPSHFFGFHDLTPWNLLTEELVCLRTTAPEDHVPTASDEAEVVIIDEVTKRETVVGTTHAWNWQKGARQRWLPALGQRVITYNAESPIGFECRIVDLDAGTTRVLPLALYDINDHDGFGLTLNFSKLFRCQPGYGYDHANSEIGGQKSEESYEADGIFRVDLATSKVNLILSIADFLKIHGLDAALGEHYFTHIQI